MKKSHAIVPRSPLVTMNVGKVPMPKLKSVPQKIVELTEGSLYFSHSEANRLGPGRKMGSDFNVCLATFIVDCHDGLTSIWLILKDVANLEPIILPTFVLMLSVAPNWQRLSISTRSM